MITVEWVDELIHRAVTCRDDARRNGEVVVESLAVDRINSLLELRAQIPEQREPAE